jgi:hypothetical protein
MKTKLLRRAGAFLLLAASLAGAHAESPDASEEAFDMTAANLMVVLRESPGVNKQDESLEPFGKISAKLPDGRVIEFEASWFQYLGDMHLRLVFDGLKRVQSALPGDLLKLKLSPEAALARAVDNLRERYGPPIIEPWTGGLMMVHGSSPDLDSSYFLDRQFWVDTARDYPEGIVAAVPAIQRRGALRRQRPHPRVVGLVPVQGRALVGVPAAAAAGGLKLHTVPINR